MMSSSRSGVACMVPLKTLKSPSAGFLVKDTIAFGVEFIQFEKVPCNGLETRSFIQEKMSSGSHCWCIEDFSQLDRPTAFSKPFQIAGYTWRLLLYPEGAFNKDYVSLYLTLDQSKSQLPPSSGVMVDMVFSIKKSQSGAYTKR
ncbi:TRAF-like family protein [Rhynchospora pubera]|uniref:TRAF-like family protein n=1 Tax=Rhynchospora pubera TaxID=906938 RepID=A0AAV8EHL2_9POAL|nr:TRAF-like family protein [Rhynchospora pubera]